MGCFWFRLNNGRVLQSYIEWIITREVRTDTRPSPLGYRPDNRLSSYYGTGDRNEHLLIRRAFGRARKCALPSFAGSWMAMRWLRLPFLQLSGMSWGSLYPTVTTKMRVRHSTTVIFSGMSRIQGGLRCQITLIL